METYYYSIVRESSSYFVQNEFDYIAQRGALGAAADLVEKPGEARRSQENPGEVRWSNDEMGRLRTPQLAQVVPVA